ncbi:unnamed protein product [Bursaphelenchus okinawaensis]|uniref:G_PROTEIN_RECEP_F1_2 domain-containing protein n=1 Tax=Bursaphelenchus okinawaensis TaxID=465554 RepID=A0A811LRU9_9BILA|nr:unnamed protein product [Bursaphelenchus okinawaensis]CAG9127285.1 unnamed protein product [Bursaphelenchus okinawaensis]
MLGIVTERCTATYYRYHYEQQTNKMAKIYAFVIIVYGCFFAWLCWYLSGHVSEVFPTRCILLNRYPVLDALGFTVCAVTVLICAVPCAYMFVYNRNVYNNRVRLESLSSRFQLNENLHVLKCFLIVFVLCFVFIGSTGFWTIQVAAYLSLYEDVAKNLVNIGVLVRVSHIMVDSVPIVFEIVFLLKHPVICRKAQSTILRYKPDWFQSRTDSVFIIKELQISPYTSAEADDYFNQLKNVWRIDESK